MTTIRTDRAHAEELDAADPLAGFRDRFVRDDKSLIYLDGNSLGPLPIATEARIAEVVRQEWGGGLVRSWASWIELPRRAGDLIGEHLVRRRAGAGRRLRLDHDQPVQAGGRGAGRAAGPQCHRHR